MEIHSSSSSSSGSASRNSSGTPPTSGNNRSTNANHFSGTPHHSGSNGSTKSRLDPQNLQVEDLTKTPASKKSQIILKIIFIVSILLIFAPCGLMMARNGLPYAITSLATGILLFCFTSYVWCRSHSQ